MAPIYCENARTYSVCVSRSLWWKYSENVRWLACESCPSLLFNLLNHKTAV
jgi:hypothetical protein